MPFIWNDERSEYLDDSVEFDRNEFVVVRKLFIQFKEDAKVRCGPYFRQFFQSYCYKVVHFCRKSQKIGFKRIFKTTVKSNKLIYFVRKTVQYGHTLRFPMTRVPILPSQLCRHRAIRLRSRKYCRQILGINQYHWNL